MSRDERRPKPVVFLAFANEQEGRRYLRELPEESRQLQAILQEAEDRGLCELVVRTNASLPVIDEVFRRHGSRVAVFHFAGHADADRLLLESASGAKAAHAEGLAGYLGGQGGVKLVFLNGCSTRPQVAELLRKGIDVVLATARPIDDAAARAFAVAFYQLLVAGRTFRDAFERARDLAKAARGGRPRAFVRDLAAFDPEDVADDRGFPWDFQVRPGAERTERTSLADLAGDPLLGLPALPSGGYLPPKPYPEPLQRFTAREASVFFGRGRAIRELYDLVTSPTSRPVILYAGPTGVGKSSVLDAGLTPRLAASHRVIYLRRYADHGLLESLLRGLSPDPKHPAGDLCVAWREAEADAAGKKKPLAVILDQAEEAFTRPLAVAPPAGTDDAAALRLSWVDPPREVAGLVGAVRALFLDASRAPLGRLILAFRKEWLQEFERPHDEAGLGYERVLLGPLDQVGIVEAIEGPTRDPDLQRHYRLTVEPGLAEAIATDLEADSGSALAPTLQVLLTKLWQGAGGPGGTFTRALYDRLYDEGILLQDVLDNGLKVLKDWNSDAVESGLALDVLAYHTTDQATAEIRSLAHLRTRYAHRAEVLDGLLGRCKEQYLLIEADAGKDPASPVPATRLAHDTLAPLVLAAFGRSQAPGQRARRLLENRASDWVNADGSPRDGAVLDRIDLMAVEQGLPGMRGLEKPEDRLLAASHRAEEHRVAEEEERQRQLREAREREEQARRDKERETALRLKDQEDANRRLRQRAYVLLAALAATIVFAGLAVWQWDENKKSAAEANTQTVIAQEQTKKAKESAKEAEAQTKIAREQARIAESRRLAVLSDAVRPKWLDLAMLLAVEAVKEGDSLEARGSLQRALDWRPEVVRFLHVPEGSVASVAFRPKGQLAVGYSVYRGGGAVVLFDARGERLRPAPLEVKEGDFTSVAFGPEGQIAVGYIYSVVAGGVAGGVVLFDARGERLRPAPLEVKEGSVTSVAFGPEGQLAAGYGGVVCGVVLFDARGERLRPAPLEVKEGSVTSVAFGPEGQLAAGYGVFGGPGRGGDRGGVVLFDARGERLRPAPLEVKEGYVLSVAFGPEGQLAAGYRVVADGVAGGVVLFDARGERLRPDPLEVKEGDVLSVAFGPEGQLAAGYHHDLVGGVVLFDARGERLRPAPLEVTEGPVSSVAFGPEGQIAAEYGNGVVFLDGRRGERLRAAPLEVKERPVTSVAFGPEGRIAAGYGGFTDGGDSVGGVVLFDARGKRIRPAPLLVKEGEVTSVAFGPEGQIAAGYGVGVGFSKKSGGVVLLDSRGERLRPAPLQVKEGDVRSVAFGPEGQIAAGYGDVRGGGGVVLFDAWGERLRPAPLEVKEGPVTSVAFGPEGQIAAGYSARGDVGWLGRVVLFDARGERLRPAPLEVKEGSVRSVAFGPEGRIAAGYGVDSISGFITGGVVLFDARGERLRAAPLEVGPVSSVAFGPAGKIAAGYDFRDGGVVLFDARGEWLRPAPLEVKEGPVSSVAFGPAGQLAAGYGDVRGGGGRRGGVVLFDTDPASWLRKAGQTAGRNFTRLEWTRYFPETPYRRTIRSFPWPDDLSDVERKQAEALEKEHPEGSDAS